MSRTTYIHFPAETFLAAEHPDSMFVASSVLQELHPTWNGPSFWVIDASDKLRRVVLAEKVAVAELID